VRAGDRVQLRSPQEILATLDESGRLDGLPFMPEMLQYFGGVHTVRAQVGRACDTISRTGVRRLAETVLLDDLRCDGSGHDGCQAGCRIYWKEAWLRPVKDGDAVVSPAPDDLASLNSVAARSVRAPESTAEEPVYRCQATELLRASEPVGWFNVRSLVGELTNGNQPPWRWLVTMLRVFFEEIGKRLRLFSDLPFRPEEKTGPGPAVSQPTLRAGQLVRVRSKGEIAPTIAKSGRNRGLWFDREMLPYCGHTTRVKRRVERFIDDKTGRMIELSSDAYILDGVVCNGYLSDGRWFCPRAIYPWWREAWLEHVDDPEAPATSSESPVRSAD
jgi:hypothetical protein